MSYFTGYLSWLAIAMMKTIGIGIESTCDETGVAIVENGKTILVNLLFSQIEEHKIYGGVVPEVASRMHLEKITHLVREAIDQSGVKHEDLSYVSCSVQPGLVGAIFVGYYTAKAISDVFNIPLIPVHHLEAHLYAPNLSGRQLQTPFIGLLLSGGNSSIYLVEELGKIKVLGDTLDDAAGEALDKAAGLLGLGYPGGPLIEELAKEYESNYAQSKESLNRNANTSLIVSGNKGQRKNPLPKILATQSSDSFKFSFSGLKTALYYIMKKENNFTTAHLAWSFQERVFEIICRNLKNALVSVEKETKLTQVVAAGGVMANKTLKNRLTEIAKEQNIEFISPEPELCTDNGAMVAALGYHYFKRVEVNSTETTAFDTNLPPEFVSSSKSFYDY